MPPKFREDKDVDFEMGEYEKEPISIEIDGEDIAPVLYSDAIRILPKSEWDGFSVEDLKALYESIRNQKRGAELNSIKLSPITDIGQLGKGAWVMNVVLRDGKMIKHIFEITGREMGKLRNDDAVPYVLFRQLSPSYNADFEGFMPAQNMLNGVSGDMYGDCLYFEYHRNQKKVEKQKLPYRYHNEEAFEEVMNLASDLQILVDAWVFVRTDSFKTLQEPLDAYFNREFAKLHGDGYSHSAILRLFGDIFERESVDFENEELERVYTTGYTMGFSEKADLATPLLERIQGDILQKLFQDETLLEKLFSKEKTSAYWRKRLHVIFEQYYGPKDVVVHATSEADKKTEQKVDNKTIAKILAVIALAERGANEDEKDAAQKAFSRLTGKEYTAENILEYKKAGKLRDFYNLF
ncbi:hypothetical protein HYW94_02885 [Candidatus Uhrbacteria bacterium]|nr:hypothetical protein [Candidatus Uhrbacteria bacterium]